MQLTNKQLAYNYLADLGIRHQITYKQKQVSMHPLFLILPDKNLADYYFFLKYSLKKPESSTHPR
jgi:hypothetical protein